MGRKGGRPTKFTPEVRKVILDTIATGVPRCHAADRAGISQTTLKNWIGRGRRASKGEFFDFLASIKKGEADAITGSVARIRKAAAGGQLLERTTKTVTTRDRSGKTTTTTTTTERVTSPQWTADAWFLERRYPEEFAANTLETKELRKIVTQLVKADQSDKKPVDDPSGKKVSPKVGGDARPEAI
jgi:hypothetical protein